MLRLNMAIPPTTQARTRSGPVGGDLAGFPNGRRVFDDVVTIELRAIAGATYPLVNPSYTPDASGVAVVTATDELTSRTGHELPVHVPRIWATPQSGLRHAVGLSA